MNLVLITAQAPPAVCGLGDHSFRLAEELRRLGHSITLVAGAGANGNGCVVEPDFWRSPDPTRLIELVARARPDAVLLQYTPLSFRDDRGHRSLDFPDFWRRCAERWKCAVIFHESYFSVWFRPRTWITSQAHKREILELADASHCVFSASRPFLDEIGRSTKRPAIYLPIGSNIPLVPIDRQQRRAALGIQPNEVLLTLFGGGNGLFWRRKLVTEVDRRLAKAQKFRWLLLGAIDSAKFDLVAPVAAPGILRAEDVSAWLQIADIFFVPHFGGLCGKRGTLMAAMQHHLPVVGTIGKDTDSFWSSVPGVVLARPTADELSGRIEVLCRSPSRRLDLGVSNAEYFERNFTWAGIAATLLQHV